MCKIKNCDGKSVGQDLCSKHYQRARKDGSLIKKYLVTPNEYAVEGSVCKIKMYNCKGVFTDYTIIDIDDIEKCKSHNWYRDNCGYAVTYKTLRLHNLVSGLTAPDHINRNKLDNRKCNLRPASESNNQWNRSKQSNNTSGYKGVSWFPSKNKWRACIQHNHKFIHIGYFNDKKDAALAYNSKAVELFGEFAVLNPILVRRKV